MRDPAMGVSAPKDSERNDCEAWVREQLRRADRGLPAPDQRVVEDLAEMLADCEREALERGVSAEQAIARARAQVPDWRALLYELDRADASAVERRVPLRRFEGSERVHARRSRSRMLSGIGRDLHSGLRAIAGSPGFSAVVLVTLALGIGANAAIFSVVDAVLLTPLPYPDPDELVRVWSDHADEGIERAGVSTGDVVEWRRRSSLFDGSSVFEGIAAWYVMGRTLTSVGAATASEEALQPAEIVNVAQVSEDFFPVLRTAPLLGRTFTREETAAATFNSAAAHSGADPVAVLSHRAWVRRFGRDPAVLERTFVLDRQRWRIAGVMPPGFDFPHPDAEMWIPWSFEGDRPHDQRYASAIARLEPGVTPDRAEAQLDGVAVALGEELPSSNEGWGVALEPLHEERVGGARATLLVLLGAVTVVLLVACSNLACLQLARIGERQREMALRLALGASRLRVARQLVVENLLLALAGGAAALLVAYAAIRLLALAGAAFLGPDAIPRLGEAELDLRVVAVAAAVSLAVGVFLGLAPLGAGARRDLAMALSEASGRSAGSAPRWERLRGFLVVAELALAVVLLASAGLLVRSYLRLDRVDLGFQPDRVAVLPIALDNHEYDSGAKSRAYYRELLGTLSAVPGVVSVGAVTALPTSPIGPDFDRPIWAEGEPPPPGGARRADVRIATPGYFETLGIPVRSGRPFDRRDAHEAPAVLVVNERLAGEVWPGEEAVGKRLVVDYGSAGVYPYEIVGVVGDVRFDGMRSEPRPEVFFPHAQRSYLIMNVVVRTAGDPQALLSDLRRAVLEVDPMQPAYGVEPLAALVAATIARDRFAAALIGSFGVVALLLALVGILGVLSYQVTRRAGEVGVRAALGATREELVAMMLRSGLRLATLGLGLGLLAAIGVTRWLDSLLFEVSPLDPATFVVVLVVTGAAALAACWLPARRAAQIDPVVALRL
ncbi:MAG TPA: ABC transporter permease [Thermoanaerobaculia bacterium]|nr:ABC transporter permease [Thermoanaerobaculia bacterium]